MCPTQANMTYLMYGGENLDYYQKYCYAVKHSKPCEPLVSPSSAPENLIVKHWKNGYFLQP